MGVGNGKCVKDELQPAKTYKQERNKYMGIVRKIATFAKPAVDRFPLFAMTYRFLRDNIVIFKEPKMTPMGFKFYGNPIMERGLYEAEEVQIVKKYLSNVDVFINIGANIGYYCCIALNLGIKTIAFEPIDLHLKYLYRNIAANSWDDIEIFPIALSKSTGVIEIYGGGEAASLVEGWAGTPKHYCRLVPTSTLDNVLCNRLAGKKCFFLIDIEGAEKDILESANAYLNLSPKPVWMVEIAITENQPAGTKINPNLLSTFNCFWENGYESWTANKEFHHVTEKDILNICKGGNDNLRTHNFLFMGRK
jgi:FkbM family methyltransferase